MLGRKGGGELFRPRLRDRKGVNKGTHDMMDIDMP